MRHNNQCNTNNQFSLDKFFDEVLGNFEGVFGRDMNPISHSMPNVNVIDAEASYNLEIAAPGRSKSDFTISLEKNILTVETKKEEATEPKTEEKFIRREFSKRSLKRSFNLPENVDKENISAKYINGVLSLEIPKVIEAEINQKIEIK